MSKSRYAPGLTSIVTFLALSYILFAAPQRFDLTLHGSHKLIAALILSYNITILLYWISFGIIGGVFLTILTVFTALVGVLRSGCYDAAFFVPTFFLPALIGYGHWKMTNKLRYSSNLAGEKLEGDINILSDVIAKKKGEIKHLDEKLLRYLVLKDVIEVLTTTLSLEEIAKLIIERAANTLKKRGRSLLFLVDVEKQELMLSASQGAPLKVKAKKGDVFDRWVLKHAIPLIVEDVNKDFRFASSDTEDARGQFRSLVITPLLSGNKTIGILRIDNPEEGAFTQDDLRLLNIIGDLGAVAIQNAFLYSWIQELAIRDSLTGLYVRRYFMKRFQEEIHRSARKNEPLSLLMLDIDRFKWYNDKYGHATGDLVLKHITNKISGALKGGDMAARYGGEEMAVLLIGADKKRALKAAELIRKKIEDEPLIVRREKHSVTVSVGVSSYPQDSSVEEGLVRSADERLYKAKAEGRNRTCAD